MFNATLSRAFPCTPSSDLPPVLLSSTRAPNAPRQQVSRAPLCGLGISWEGSSEALQSITMSDSCVESYDHLSVGGLQPPFVPSSRKQSWSQLDRAFDGLTGASYCASSAESIESSAMSNLSDEDSTSHSRAPSTAPSSVASPRSPPQQPQVDCGRFLSPPTPAHSPAPSHPAPMRSLGTRERLETRLRGLAIDVESASSKAVSGAPSGLGININTHPSSTPTPSQARRRRSPSSPPALETSFSPSITHAAGSAPRLPSGFIEGAELKWLRREAYLLIPLRVTSSPRPAARGPSTRAMQDASVQQQQRTASLPPPTAAMARRRMPSARFHPYGLGGATAAASASPFSPPSTVPPPSAAAGSTNATRPWDL